MFRLFDYSQQGSHSLYLQQNNIQYPITPISNVALLKTLLWLDQQFNLKSP